MDDKVREMLRPPPPTTDPHVEAVREKLLQRSQRGVRKYGVTTAQADLTFAVWLQHFQEELLDGAVYAEVLMRKMEEGVPDGEKVVE